MKKALSLILAIIMVVAMIPAGAMAADATAESYTYNFKTGLHTSSGHIGACLEWKSTDPYEGEWTFARYYLNASGSIGTNYAKNKQEEWNDFFTVRPKFEIAERTPVYSPGVAFYRPLFGMYLTVEINVEESGTYFPSLSLITKENSPKFEIYLTESDGTVDELGNAPYINWVNALDSSDRLGAIDGYGTGDVVTEVFVDRKLEKGKYYLVFIANGKNENCEFSYEQETNSTTGVTTEFYRGDLCLKSFSLTNAAAQPTKYSYNITSSALADPTTASSYNLEDNGAWNVGGMKTLAYTALADGEEKYRVYGYGYALDGSLSDTGLSLALYTDRYVEHASNGYFELVDGVYVPKADYATYAYSGGSYLQMQINVPAAGEYKLSLLNQDNDATYGMLTNVYFSPLTSSTLTLNDIIEDSNDLYKLDNRHDCREVHLGTAESAAEYIGTINVPAPGDYYLIFSPDGECFTENNNTFDKTASNSPSRKHQRFYLSGIKLEATTNPVDEIKNAVAADQTAFNEIKATKTNEIATAKNEGLSETAFVNVLNTSIDGSFSELGGKIVATRGEDVTVKADTVEGYDFLYWRQGLGADAKVIASSTECTVKAAPGTWLTAVYKPTTLTGVSVLFYNADGEIIDSDLVANGETITLPSAPTAPKGCGKFLGWALNTPDNIVEEEATASGKSMVFVAQFEASTAKNIEVTVNGGATGGGSYAYGETVTVTATEREGGSGSNVFVYWKKG
ncbi:MAG: hypothetical protein IJF32_12155, partial [Oscillospiraceae bacterium]|nr:hypothetical protein [Oscillospiraceae bacterium]